MDQEVKSSEKNFQQADKEQIDNNDLVLQARLQPQKKQSRQNSSIEARTLQNMRTMKNAHQLKPVLQQQSAQRVGKIAKTSREPSIENITTATVNASVNVERNKILIPREERRQVFSTHQNKDLVSLQKYEVHKALDGRPPRANLQRKFSASRNINSFASEKRKK